MPKPRKISVNQTTVDMGMAFSNMAADIFENIITQVKNSNLNFQMELSPFSAVIHLKKSILKDKSGNFLLQKTPKPSEKFSNVDEILRKNEALEQEVAKLQRTCEEVNRSLTLVESKLKILDQEIINDSEEIENSLPAHASTPLAKKSISFRKPLSDSGLDLEDSKISSPTSCKTAEFHHNLKDKEKEKAVSQTSKKKNENKKIKTNAKADSDQHKVCDISTLGEKLVSKSTDEQNCSSLQSKHGKKAKQNNILCLECKNELGNSKEKNSSFTCNLCGGSIHRDCIYQDVDEKLKDRIINAQEGDTCYNIARCRECTQILAERDRHVEDINIAYQNSKEFHMH